MWLLIIAIYVVRTFVGQLMFCAVMNLINNSVDVYNMGAANGLGTLRPSISSGQAQHSYLLPVAQAKAWSHYYELLVPTSLLYGHIHLRALRMQFSALNRALGSFVVLLLQVMFAWSMTSGMVFPFNFYFVFVLMSVVTLFILGLSFLLSQSLNTPKTMPSASVGRSTDPRPARSSSALRLK
jgi:hypothetical protein